MKLKLMPVMVTLLALALIALVSGFLLRAPTPPPDLTPPTLTAAGWSDAESVAGTKSRGAPGEEEESSALDHFLDRLETAHLAFNTPGAMQLEKIAVVQMIVGPGRTEEELGRLITEAGEVQSASVRIADDMEAKLSGAAFRITSITPDVQSVSRREPTEWKWEVQPLQPGRQRLHLTLTAVFMVDGRERQRATTFEKVIEVGVSGHAWSRRLMAVGGGAGSLGMLVALLQLGLRLTDLGRSGRFSLARFRRRASKTGAGGATKAGDEVFVSYARRDSEAVRPLLDALRDNGVHIWVDQSGIQGATLWSAEIVGAIQRARAVILFCSAASFASEHVQREVALASEERRRLLPVRLDTAEPPAAVRYHLAGIQYVDIAGLPARDAAARIRAALETVAPAPAQKS